MTKKLSVVLATRNEEQNIKDCLLSVKDIADEIIIVDEESADKTVAIARSFGAKVSSAPHEAIFHKTKQKALELASGKWILQLDADERVTEELAKEIREVIEMSDQEILNRRPKDSHKWNLFQRHLELIEKRDGKIGKDTGEVVAFFLPRLNFFLGKPLIHGGVYPDPAIRLIKKNKAWFPAKDVHEIMEINGEVAWLFFDLEHHDSPNINRYIMRLNRYTDLHAQSLEAQKYSKTNLAYINYTLIKPKITFLKLYFRHLGYKDGLRGFLWALFSSWHYPIAYWKYLTGGYKS